jgi:hypothetical protein
LVSIGWHCFGFPEVLLSGLVRLSSQSESLLSPRNASEIVTIENRFSSKEITPFTSHLKLQFSNWLLAGLSTFKISTFDISDFDFSDFDISNFKFLDISDSDLSDFDLSNFKFLDISDFDLLNFKFLDISIFDFSNSEVSRFRLFEFQVQGSGKGFRNWFWKDCDDRLNMKSEFSFLEVRISFLENQKSKNLLVFLNPGSVAGPPLQPSTVAQTLFGCAYQFGKAKVFRSCSEMGGVVGVNR